MTESIVFIITSTKVLHPELNLCISSIQQKFGSEACRINYTQYKGHAIDLAKEAAIRATDLIVAVGGDGTVNEVLNGMIQSGKSHSNLGIIPHGTGNDFCKAQNIIFNASRILEAIQHPAYHIYDTVKVTQHHQSRYFMNVMDAGFGGFATNLLDKQRTKGLNGKLSYSVAILRSFFAFKKPIASVWIDEKLAYQGKLMMLAIANGSTFGNGLVIYPEAKADDALLGVVILGKVSLLDYVLNLQKLKKGIRIKHRSVFYETGKMIRLDDIIGSTPIELDGEVFGNGPCTIEIVPKSIKIWHW